MSLSPALSDEQNQNNSSSQTDDDQSSIASSQDSPPQAKRFCSREEPLPYIDLSGAMRYAMQQQTAAAAALMNDFAPAFFPQLPQMPSVNPMYMPSHASSAYHLDSLSAQQQQRLTSMSYHPTTQTPNSECDYNSGNEDTASHVSLRNEEQHAELFVDVVSTSSEDYQAPTPSHSPAAVSKCQSSPQTDGLSNKRSASAESLLSCDMPAKRSSFSISSILGSNTRNVVTV